MRSLRLTVLAWVSILFLQTSAPAAEEKSELPVKVFVLAGQSNMQGQGAVKTLDWLGQDGKFDHLLKEIKNEDGSWKTREDVWVYYPRGENNVKKGKLTVGFGAGDDKIGPELFFGHVMGEHYENPVLLIKTAWGGRSLAGDFRPPSSGGETGKTYQEMISIVQEGLQNIGENFPELKGREYELAGFVWFQGWNDYIDANRVAEYETNMVNLIKDIRQAWNAPNLPVVIGGLGVDGNRDPNNQRMIDIRKAQAAPAARDEFKGTVAYVNTADYWDNTAHDYLNQHWVKRVWSSPEAKEEFEKMGTQPPYHYLGSGKIMSLIGDAMGNAMVELVKE